MNADTAIAYRIIIPLTWTSTGATDDAEGDEHDGREPDSDNEYELGWPEMVNQDRATKASAMPTLEADRG